jgi:hypothetical protein
MNSAKLLKPGTLLKEWYGDADAEGDLGFCMVLNVASEECDQKPVSVLRACHSCSGVYGDIIVQDGEVINNMCIGCSIEFEVIDET